MKKIKVLQIVGSLRSGGLETVAMNFIRYADKEKYEIHFLTFQDEKEYYDDEVIRLNGKIIKISSPQNGICKFIKSLNKILRENGPYDVVHSHTFYNSGITLLIAKFNKVPIRIAHIHTKKEKRKIKNTKKIYNLIMRILINLCSNKKCACSFEAGCAAFGKKIFKAKGLVIKNCIDIDKYKFNIDFRKEKREELNILNDDILIGNIGRLEDVKNQKFLIEMIKKIKSSKYKLAIVGEGTLYNELSKMIEEEKLNKRVFLLGNRKDVNELLSSFDVFVLPSKYEGFSIALLEAQANGLQCFASKGRVPQEVKILENFMFVNLDKGTEIWKESIIEKTNCKRIENATNILKSENYDISNFKNYISILYEY